MRTMTAAALLGAALFLAACQPASTISTLHGVTTESNALGPKFTRLFWGSQWESVSLLGLLPAREPGVLHSYNPRRGPNSAIGVSEGDSYFLTRTVGADVTLDEVLALRDALLQAQDSAANATRARLEALRTALDARAAGGSPAAATQAEAAAGEDAPQAQTATVADKAAREAKKAESQFTTAEQAVRQALKKPGLLVVRWSVAQESEYNASSGERASLSGGSGAGRSGLAVLGGIRVARLYVGKDIGAHWTGLRNIGAFTTWPQVTTLLIQARHVAFLSDVSMESYFKAEVAVDAQTVAQAAADWKTLAELELAAYRARVANLGGMGLLGAGGSLTRAPAPWAGADPSRLEPCPQEADADWHTLYQVTTPLKALREMWEP